MHLGKCELIVRMMLLNQRWGSVHAGPGSTLRTRRSPARTQAFNAKTNATDCNVTISNATDVNTQKEKAGVKFLSGIYGNVPCGTAAVMRRWKDASFDSV
jgi:hypothetical protein